MVLQVSKMRHRHLFKEVENGIEMIDIVHYKLPYGVLGKVIEKLIVKKKIERIFDYRERVITDVFN